MLPAHKNCLVFPADAVFNVELEGQTLCLLSPSLTTTVGHHSTNSIQSFFQRREEATTTADDVGKHCSPGGGFNSLHSSSSNCAVFFFIKYLTVRGFCGQLFKSVCTLTDTCCNLARQLDCKQKICARNLSDPS